MHDLAASFARHGALAEGWAAVEVGDACAERTTPIADLDVAWCLERLRARTGACDERTVGAAVADQLGKVLALATLPWVGEGRVPSLDPARTGVRPWHADDGAALALCGEWAAGGAAAMAAELERAYAPVVAAIHGATGFAPRAQWGLFAAALGAFAGHELAAALLAAGPRLGQLPPRFTPEGVVYGACCRAYLWCVDGAERCEPCPLRATARRRAAA